MKNAKYRRTIAMLLMVCVLSFPTTGYVAGSEEPAVAPEALLYEELISEPSAEAEQAMEPEEQDAPEIAEVSDADEEVKPMAMAEVKVSSVSAAAPMEANPYADENGYITSTFGYPIQSDPFAGEGAEVLSQTGGQIRDLEGSKMGSRQEIIDAGQDDFYILSDAMFFGKWDDKTQSWERPSEIDYQNYPGLSGVENAVKSGDYDAAKAAYLEYYRTKLSKMEIAKTTSVSNHNLLVAKLLQKNLLYPTQNGTTMLDLIYLDQAYDTYSVDATSWVNSYKGSRNEIGFYIMATDKDGGMGEFKSRESGDGPILRVAVNGNVVELSAKADLYVSAGTNENATFGTGNTLLASESKTANTDFLVDANTNRIYMTFDISSLKSGDTISSANLILKGRNAVDNKKKKEILVLHTEDTAIVETSTTWKQKPSTVFSYDQMTTWAWEGPGHQRNVTFGSRFMEDLPMLTFLDNLASVYEFTRDEAHGYTAIRIFMDFLNVMGSYPRYFADSNMGSRVATICQMIPKLIDSEYMSPEVFAGMMKELWIEGNEMSKHCTTGNNWGTYEKRGHYIETVMFPEFADSNAWLEKIYEHLEEILINTVRDDGSGAETVGYMWSNVINVVQLPNLTQQLGLYNVPSPYNETVKEQIRKITTYCMDLCTPGWHDPQEGDTDAYSLVNWRNRFIQVANAINDPVILWAATDGRQGTPPGHTSLIYDGIGKKAVMRTGWTADANYLYCSVDGGRMVHAHHDDNNLILHAYGNYLLTDQLYGSYSGAGNITTWFRSPQAHNTITMNDKTTQDYVLSGNGGYVATMKDEDVVSHTGIPRWESNSLYDFITMDTANTIGADSFKRHVLFVKPGFWLVSDYLVPTNQQARNLYKQTWHYLPTANLTMDSDSKITESHFGDKANLQVVPIGADQLSSSFLEDGYYSQNQGSYMDSKYAVYEKEQSGNTTFNTILYPQEIGKECTINAQEIMVPKLKAEDYSAYSFTITDKMERKSQYQFFILHNAKKRGQHVIGNYSTDASMLLVQTDNYGNTVSFIAQDASYIKNTVNGRNVLKSDNALTEFSAAWSGSRCELSGSKITADKLRQNNVVLSNAGTQSMQLNGQTISFEQTNQSVYFGKKPTDVLEETENPDNSGSVVSGGSTGGNSGGISHGSGLPGGVMNPDQPLDPTWENPFTDVSAADWFYDAVQYVNEKNLFRGVTQTDFDPSGEMTRAMAVTVLHRLSGAEAPAETENPFVDVAAEDWYSKAVAWASATGVVTGVDATHFDPNTPVTRQQFAALLYRYAGAQAPTERKLDQFGDGGEIAEWAQDAVAWALEAGLMNGADGMLLPENNIARAEAAAMLQRFSTAAEQSGEKSGSL